MTLVDGSLELTGADEPLRAVRALLRQRRLGQPRHGDGGGATPHHDALQRHLRLPRAAGAFSHPDLVSVERDSREPVSIRRSGIGMIVFKVVVACVQTGTAG